MRKNGRIPLRSDGTLLTFYGKYDKITVGYETEKHHENPVCCRKYAVSVCGQYHFIRFFPRGESFGSGRFARCRDIFIYFAFIADCNLHY